MIVFVWITKRQFERLLDQLNHYGNWKVKMGVWWFPWYSTPRTWCSFEGTGKGLINENNMAIVTPKKTVGDSLDLVVFYKVENIQEGVPPANAGAMLQRPFWTALWVMFLLLVNVTSESISIGLY